MNSHSFMFTLDMTPPAVPASSPEDLEYLAPLTIGISPSVFTFVGPSDVSDAWPMFGYGMGTGPAGDGVLQTSGKAVLIPPLPLCAMPRRLAKVVCAITQFFAEAFTIRTARWPRSDEPYTRHGFRR